MRTNKYQAPQILTAEGGRAVSIGIEQQLQRLVNACFLWEDNFYIDGKTVAELIKDLTAQCSPEFVAKLATTARHEHHLRHVSLLLTAALAVHPKRLGSTQLVRSTITSVIDRADELGEFLAIYASVVGVAPRVTGNGNGFKKKLSAAAKRGVAAAFDKFREYHFSKYNREGAFSLRDVARIVHPGSSDPERGALYRRIFRGEPLAAAGTWEERLSSGEDKKTVWESMLREGTLGYLALLRNLRNMDTVGVDKDLIKQAIVARKGAHNVLPFRFTAAARHAPWAEKELDKAMLASIAELPRLQGKTIVLVDVSGSMNDKLSAKSDMRRVDAAATLASMIDGDVRVFTFDRACRETPHRLGMAGIDAIVRQCGGSTMLGAAIQKVNQVGYDRLIVLTDEQSHDSVPAPKGTKTYMINVGVERNGVGYRNGWVHIDGFSESVLRFIAAHEATWAAAAVDGV